jgi:hypothetical protein
VNVQHTRTWRAPVTRRTLMQQMAGGLLAIVATRGRASRAPAHQVARSAPAPAAPQPGPVVSFFLDQPYVDTSGLGVPYLPPRGLRAGQPLAALGQQEFRSIAPHG